jgi:hypothetical protein
MIWWDPVTSTLSLLGATVASTVVARDIMRDILADDRTARERGEWMAEWLEDVLPLKGRWLRCLRAGPAITIILVPVFVGSYVIFGLLIAMLTGIAAARP